MLDYTDLTVEDVTASGLSRADLFHPEDLEKVREDHLAALSRGVPFEIEKRAPKGRPISLVPHPFRRPFHDEKGRPVR